MSAIVLANLCVSYIMTGQNEEAEELMRKIEREEEQVAFENPEQKLFHLCIVNMVIGTLYCAKGNYDFGISRIIKSLEPYNKKLGTDTWYTKSRKSYRNSHFFQKISKDMTQIQVLCQKMLHFHDWERSKALDECKGERFWWLHPILGTLWK